MTEPLAVHPVDRHVGQLLRLRRLELDLSQAKIAAPCDISFQQLQKYERGANRVSVSMLVQLSRTLGVAPGHFVNDAPGALGGRKAGPVHSEAQELVTATPGALDALRLFARLPLVQRTTLLTLMEQLAEPTAPPLPQEKANAA